MATQEQGQVKDLQPIDQAQEAQSKVTDLQPIDASAPAAPSSSEKHPEGWRPPIDKTTKAPEKPGYLDTANDQYEKGTGVGNALGRLALTPINMGRAIYHSVVDKPKNAEESAVETASSTPMASGAGRLGLAAKRILYDPQEAEYKKAKSEAEQGHTAESMGHSVAAAVPLVGPYAAQLGERAGRGDISGAITEGAGMALLPKIAKEAMPGGMLPGALPEGARPFPAADSIVRGASKVASKALPTVPYIAGAAAGHPYIGAKVYRAIVPDAIAETVEKGKVYGLPEEEAAHQQLEERAQDSEKAATKTQAEVDKYKASKTQGIEPPEDVVKSNAKAQAKAAEDRFHADTAKEAMEKAKQERNAPADKPVETDHMAGFQRDIDSMAPRVSSEKATPLGKPINVKGPGEIQPETFPQEPTERPTVDEGKNVPLAEGEGMRLGKPKLLSEKNPESPLGSATKQEVLPPEKPKKFEPGNVKALTVDEKGNVIDKEQATPEARMESLLREGLKPETKTAAPKAAEYSGPTEEAPHTAEQDENRRIAKYIADTDKERAKIKAEFDAKRNETAVTDLKPIERSPEAADTEPKVAEQVANLKDESLKKLAKAHGIDPEQYDFKSRDEGRHRTERDQLVKDITSRMGDDEVLNLGRNAAKLDSPDTAIKAKADRAESVFPRLRGETDEFGNPKVSGGAPSEGLKDQGVLKEKDAKEFKHYWETRGHTVVLDPVPGANGGKTGKFNVQLRITPEETVGTAEGAKFDTEHFANAKKELGDKASISDVAKRAQEMKDSASKPVDVAKSASSYNKEAGLPEIKPEKVAKDTRAAEIADDFAKMEHDPKNPEVKKSYDALVDDVKKQWDYATKKMGIKIEPTDTDPYKNYEEMKEDVNKNKTMKVWRGGNELAEDHPLGKVDPKTGESYNTMFRAVHDIFGHVAQDHDFSEPGEESAWNVHRQMMTPDAVPAMTTETRGQTSWFFNNEGVRGGEPLGKFADQKAGLLPEYANERTPDAKETLDHIKSGKDYAVMTAENPNNTRLSPMDNVKRNRELIADLKEKGYKPVPVEGNNVDVEGRKEHSFFVPDITPKDAAELARKHGQESVLTTQGLHHLDNDMLNPSDNSKLFTGEEAKKQDYSTKVGDQDFSVPLEDKQKYIGDERRGTERKAPLNATELEQAMKSRKGVHTPFDVTEGAMDTIARDKAMPKHPSEEGTIPPPKSGYLDYGEPDEEDTSFNPEQFRTQTDERLTTNKKNKLGRVR